MLYQLALRPLNQKKQKQKSYCGEDQMVASLPVFIRGSEKKVPHIFKFPLLDARVRFIRQAQPYFRHANNIH